jgi:hypothetical protein
MSLSSASRRNDYVGNGAASTYAYGFRITDETHLRVTVRNTDAEETTLTLNTHYTVTGVDAAAGGNVLLTAGGFAWLTANKLTTDYALAIRRIVPLKQETDVRNQGTYFPEIHEDAFDYLTFIDQQQQDEIDRSVKLPESVASAGFSTALPADVAVNPGAAIIINDDGDGLALGDTATDVARVFNSTTYAALKALSAAAPTVQRQGWATDIKQLMYYCADVTVGDAGWFPIGG